MSFLFRCLVLSLAAFGVAALVSSVAVALVWWRPHAWALGTHLAPAGRADALLRVRLAPAMVAALTGVFAAVGLWRFESREIDEVLGWTLGIGATFGATFVCLFAARAWRMADETRRLLGAWLAGGTRITLPGVTVPAFRINTGFPVVAVVGILRPTLVVDAVVLDACSAGELSAILAHEQGHVRRWDNLRRALFAATPDLLSATQTSQDLRAAWREATEEAADDLAAERGEDARVHLATALLRVARLASVSPTATLLGSQLPASSLYHGESVERRVRRLCAAPMPASRTGRHWGLFVGAGAMATALLVQRDIHGAMELIIAALP